MAAFSRLQLAKALIEYDNEYLPPDQPPRRAEESAIFLSLRRNLPSRQPLRQRNTDYLGVSLPSDSSPLHGGERASVSIRDSLLDPAYRKSAASLDALRNPFGRDSTIEGAPIDVGDGIEVDLSSWGLDALVDKDKGKGKGKGKQVQRQESTASVLPNPHPPLQLHDAPRRIRPSMTNRTLSMGNIPFSASTSREDLSLGIGGAFLDAKSSSVTPPATLNNRRHSVGSPLDYVGVHPSDPALAHKRKASGHALIDNIPITPPLHAVPFPNGNEEDAEQEGLVYDEPEEPYKNPFTVSPPSPEHASRFDPKTAPQNRAASHGSIDAQMRDAESPQAADSSSPSPFPGRDRPYSRLELMRPKLLIMPSPLQSSAPEVVQSESRDGFQITTDGPPLPPGAKTGARGSAMDLLSPPTSLSPITTGGDYFSPNPRANLTLSQLTFRNTLMVDGQRDVAYKDIDDHLRWASEEGEQVQLPEVQPPKLEVVDVDAIDADEFDQQKKKDKRPPGKLYGKSLIDDLQARKVEMKSKQRVFTGDQRPSMMARTPMKRSSTLIDPESLKQRPISTLTPSPGLGETGLTRRNSAHAKTLINFDDEIPGAPRGAAHLTVDNPHGGGMTKTKSVFGVDTLWEREMTKLREIEEREKEEEEERKRQEEEEEGRGRKKGKGKLRRKSHGPAALASPPEQALSPSPSQSQGPMSPSVSVEPPAVSKRARVLRAPPPPVEGDDSEEDEASDSSSVAERPAAQAKPNGWYSDEENDGPRRTTGSGPRYANLPPRLRALQEQSQYQDQPREDEDSEEDLPLVATIGRAAQRATRTDLAGVNTRRAGVDSSDEEVPLSQLLDKTKLKLPSPTFGGSVLGSNAASKSVSRNEDDDDQPLGLRASRLLPSSHSQALSSRGGGGAEDDEDEDDVPLALHPEQMRRSQFMMVAQQQQQQQMMMQAAAAQMQMQQSMMFGAPSIMSAPFFGPPMAPPMLMPPQVTTTPPPMPDTAKLTRVDKWRHDVAVEEER